MKRFSAMIMILLLLTASTAAGYWYFKYKDLSGRFAKTFYSSGVTVDDVVIPKSMTYIEHEGRLFLDIRIVQGWLDDGAYVSPSGERLYLRFDALGFETGDEMTDAMLRSSLETLSLPIYTAEEQHYVELEALSRLFRMHWERNLETGIINIVTHRARTVTLSVPMKTYAVLEGVDVFELMPDQTYNAVKSEAGRLSVFHPDGRIGTVEVLHAIKVRDSSLLPVSAPLVKSEMPNRIVGAWDQVHRYDHNFNFNPANGSGVGNVIMPTWFDLNVDGIVLNLADMAYVLSAQEAGWQVWGLYANHFSPAWTSEVLHSEALTNRTIAHVVAYAVAFGLDGINIDFENMYLKDQSLYTSYVEKLAAALRRVGKWVSVDVTVPEGSDQWSKVFDRPALSSAVDFVFLMAYDEHWATSAKAGSVASRDWTESGIVKSLDMIPKEKLILGMPLYTRVWEEAGTGSSKKVTSSTLSFMRTSAWLKDRGLTPVFDKKTGQNYVEYKSGTTIYKAWLEDETSLAMRLKLMESYKLAGLGFWSIDFANEEVWEIIKSQ